MIIKKSKHLRLPARKYLFKQGDKPDFLYILLKGRVAVEKSSNEYGNLPLVVSIIKDGEYFGELSLVS